MDEQFESIMLENIYCVVGQKGVRSMSLLQKGGQLIKLSDSLESSSIYIESFRSCLYIIISMTN